MSGGSKLISIATIGSGPAALYTAQYLLKNLSNFSKTHRLNVDIYERLPVPFGLVRYGVAPDHQDVKNVINSFTDTLKGENVNFFGNVNIGKDVRIDELLRAYNFVVLAYGSQSENYLNVPGEKEMFGNFVSAKSFVSWYNGLPVTDSSFSIDLKCKRAVIIGAGNVSLDIARILLSPTDKLSKTDISRQALDTIRQTNQIESVSIVARRGILNTAFTLKELRELTKIQAINCQIDLGQFDDIRVDRIIDRLARPRKRLTQFLHELAKKSTTSSSAGKTLQLDYLRSPAEIIGDEVSKRVKGVRFNLNKYAVDFDDEKLKLDDEQSLNALKIVDDNDKSETKEADLVIRSIGYKNVSIDEDVPFDKSRSIVPNDQGKVIGKEGLFCTGWIKRGPRGVIVDTTSDAYETAQKLCSTLMSTSSMLTEKKGAREVAELLRSRNVNFVDKIGWHKIDQEEIRRGKLAGKPREKISTIKEMLEIASS